MMIWLSWVVVLALVSNAFAVNPITSLKHNNFWSENPARISIKDDPPTNGSCGSNMIWSFDASSSTLTISGTGNMTNYNDCGPWSSFADLITTIVIGDNVESIGDYAFYACSALTTVSMSNSVKSIGKSSFQLCKKLTSITLPDSLEVIKSKTFHNCVALESIVLPSSLKSIEDYGLSFSNLQNITIPASVESINEYAFRGCSALTSFAVDTNNTHFKALNGVLFSNDGKILYFYPIGKKSYSYIIPKNVNKVRSSAFFQSTNLGNITVNSGNMYYSSNDGVLFDKNQTTILKYPSKKTGTSYTIPSTVKSIITSAFYSCNNLETIIIQEGVESLESESVCLCNKLKSVLIPASVKQMSGGCISRCNELTEVNVNENNTMYKSSGGIVFSKDGKTLVLYPAGLKDSYYAIPEGVTILADYAFCTCQLEFVTLPSTLQTIKTLCFSKSPKLKSIVIPDSVNLVDSLSFSKCSNLKSVVFLGSIDSIALNAFEGCDIQSIIFLGNKTLTSKILGISNIDNICVSPEYEGTEFCGHSNLIKSTSCQVNVTIDSMEAFYQLIETTQTIDTLVYNITLEIDLDFNNDNNFTHPLGYKPISSGGSCNMFKGTLEGNGHVIKNLNMNNDGCNVPSSSLFCGLHNATIHNIVIDKTCSFQGNDASIISTVVKGDVTIMDIINEANVYGSESGSGLISNVGNDNEMKLTINNCDNKGNVNVSNGNACGLICAENTNRRGTINIYNSMNKGIIEGTNAYGISMYTIDANNVVSMGDVINNNGGNESYSLWPSSASGTHTYIYCLNATCVNCNDDNVTIITLDTTLNVYKTNDNNRVDELLNIESEANGYGMLWSKQLSLTYNLSVSITFNDGTNIILHPPYGTILREVPEIKQYFDGSIGDEEVYVMMEQHNKSIVIKPNTIIRTDMDIILSQRINAEGNNYQVIVELEEGNNVTKDDIDDLISLLCESLDIDADSLFISLNMDKKTNTVNAVTVTSGNKDIALKICSFINDNKSSFRQIAIATFIAKELPIDASSRHATYNLSAVLFVAFLRILLFI